MQLDRQVSGFFFPPPKHNCDFLEYGIVQILTHYCLSYRHQCHSAFTLTSLVITATPCQSLLTLHFRFLVISIKTSNLSLLANPDEHNRMQQLVEAKGSSIRTSSSVNTSLTFLYPYMRSNKLLCFTLQDLTA